MLDSQIQHTFMIKAPNKLGIESNFLNLIQVIYEKFTVNIFNGESLDAFPLLFKKKKKKKKKKKLSRLEMNKKNYFYLTITGLFIWILHIEQTWPI